MFNHLYVHYYTSNAVFNFKYLASLTTLTFNYKKKIIVMHKLTIIVLQKISFIILNINHKFLYNFLFLLC